ncbi:hypothetical protein [Spirosoma rigui]|uniref:hypothetical protein n=1 Tax=Spirosoma rigui TaxID=564064 RepID=UPI0009AF960C|nr:hypothetical protein [Spirosoma rigui]
MANTTNLEINSYECKITIKALDDNYDRIDLIKRDIVLGLRFIKLDDNRNPDPKLNQYFSEVINAFISNYIKNELDNKGINKVLIADYRESEGSLTITFITLIINYGSIKSAFDTIINSLAKELENKSNYANGNANYVANSSSNLSYKIDSNSDSKPESSDNIFNKIINISTLIAVIFAVVYTVSQSENEANDKKDTIILESRISKDSLLNYILEKKIENYILKSNKNNKNDTTETVE